MNYRCETNLQEIEKYLRGAGVVAFDFETAPLPAYRDDNKAALDAHRSHIVGVSLSVAEGSAVYVPLRHLRGPNTDLEQIIPFLRGALWMNPAVVKIAHNLSFEAMFLYALGVVVQPPCYDTIAAAQMTLLFIHAQHLLHLVVQSVILLFQTVCNILVHCRFADAERFGRAAHGGAGLRDVFAQLHRPLLRIALHAATTPYLCLLHIYGGFGRFMRTKRRERPAYSKM